MEATLAKRRENRLPRHPVAWITRGSDAWFTLAATLMNPVIVPALARMIGQPVGPRPVRSVHARSGWPRPATQSSSRPRFTTGFAAGGRSARHRARLDTGCWTGSGAEGGDHRPGRSGGPCRQVPAPGRATAVRFARNQKRHRRIRPVSLSSAMSQQRHRRKRSSQDLLPQHGHGGAGYVLTIASREERSYERHAASDSPRSAPTGEAPRHESRRVRPAQRRDGHR